MLFLFIILLIYIFRNKIKPKKQFNIRIKDNTIKMLDISQTIIKPSILKSMQQDYTVCYVFYKIGSQSIFQSQENDDLAKAIASSSDVSLKLAFETGELANMTIEEMKKRVNLEIEKQLKIIKNDNSNYSILLKKYSKF